MSAMIATVLSRPRPSLPAYLRAYALELARMRLLGHSEAFSAIAAFRAAAKHLTCGGAS